MNYISWDNTSDSGNHSDTSRSKVNEIQEGSVVIEIYEKPDDYNNRLFFDLKCSREYILRDTREKKRGSYLHQRDIGDLIIAAICAQKWINARVREFRSEE